MLPVGRPLGLKVEVRQTDDEAEMVRWMHQAVDEQTPVVMNPAAFTHYSYALADAAHMVGDAGLPLIEVHISNPSAVMSSASVRSSARSPPAPSREWDSTGTSSRWTPSRILSADPQSQNRFNGWSSFWCACASGLLRLVWCP